MFLKKFGFFNANRLLINSGVQKTEFLNTQSFNFATKMRAGVTKNKKDSAGKRLGVKKFGGEEVRPGQILVRQRGFEWKLGENIYHGRDHTFHAAKEGKVSFSRDPWSIRRRTHVHVVEQETPNRLLFPPKPFMYHPELYPELAKKNGYIPPLPLSARCQRKSVANSNPLEADNNQQTASQTHNTDENTEPELKTVEVEDVISSNKKTVEVSKEKFPNLLKFIRRASRRKSIFREELATNYFEISSIRKEINQTGEVYFGANNFKNRSDIIDNYMNIMEADKNYQTFEFNAHTKNIESEKFNSYSNYATSYFVEKNRANYLSTQAPELEDLLEELKTKNRVSSVIDLSGIPSTENAHSKVVRNPKDNLNKIKQYYEKMEKKNVQKSVKDFREKEKAKGKGPEGDKGKKDKDSNKSKKAKN